MRKFLSNHKLLLFIAFIVPWFFVGGPGHESSRSFKEAWSLGHVLFFAVFAVAVDGHFDLWRRPTFSKKCLFLFVVVGFASGIELLQTLSPGREVSLQDILLGFAGAVILLLWHDSGRRRMGGKILLRGCGAAIIMICLAPLLLTLYDEFRAGWDFPVLADFESALELSRWEDKDHITRVQAPVKSGSFALKASLTTEKYSGVSLCYFPENWGTARALTFSVYNPGEVVVLHYRVHDWKHRDEKQDYNDRFNGRTSLAAGWNTIRVPIEEIVNGPKQRKMDLAHIRGLHFFVTEQPYERVLYFDDIRLLQ